MVSAYAAKTRGLPCRINKPKPFAVAGSNGTTAINAVSNASGFSDLHERAFIDTLGRFPLDVGLFSDN
jgi:hypothetical protein